MSQSCAVTKCDRTSRGLCDCCQQNLCLQHLSEHNASLVSQLNPLTDEINALGDRFKSLNIEKAVGSCRRKLEQWRDDCHQRIDRLFQQKSKEFNQLIDQKIKKQQEELVRIQSKVAELIREEETTRQDIDSLRSTIHNLKEQMDKIENTCFNIDTYPLVIDESFIDFKELDELDISSLSPVCKTIDRLEESSKSFVSNDRFLLIHQVPNLCLVGPEMNVVKQTLWSHGQINDMCWSSTLNRFIVIGKEMLFLVSKDTLMTDNVQTIQKRKWISCTSSETSLFLVTNELASSIMKFTLLPNIELIKEWKSPDSCTKNEYIDDIRHDKEKIALMIWNVKLNSLFIELKHVETLARIWSLQLNDAGSQKVAFRCCSLPGNEWLVVQHGIGNLLQITKDGKLKKVIKYKLNPYRAGLMGINILIILTNNNINLHKLQ
jgi:polyhydroxyalkanoate synthesis regulator phasin